MFSRLFLVASIALVTAGTGCTHSQLRSNTVHQAQTLSELYEQQVLNNLAKFVYDPNALPDFAIPDAGASEVIDAGDLGFSVDWIASGFDAAGLSGAASREMSESWTLAPVTDPRKLELMRCAYQRAIASCCPGGESAHCPDCRKSWARFYLGTENPDTQESFARPEPEEGESDKQYQRRLTAWSELPWNIDDALQRATRESGMVTSECIAGPCWFQVGCQKCLSRHKQCALVGHYCGVHVWVLPGRGSDQLAKLTLAILDYATNEPIELRQKRVEIYLGPDGRTLAPMQQAAIKIDAVLDIDEDPLSLVAQNAPSNQRLMLESPNGGAPVRSGLVNPFERRQRTPTPGNFFPSFRQRLDALGGQ